MWWLRRLGSWGSCWGSGQWIGASFETPDCRWSQRNSGSHEDLISALFPILARSCYLQVIVQSTGDAASSVSTRNLE
jgi:hypothetical protein